MEKLRKIIHVDMDAFFASVEQRENPEYINKPLVVGGNRERGVVAAASYEARKFDVYSAMSIKVALQKCPELIIVKPNFELYKEVSRQIRQIFHDYTALVEPLSLDEAFLDVTINKTNHQYATQIAKEIKIRIFEEMQLTASAGISFNKFLAKMASDVNKPDGFYVIPPENAIDFIEKLPIHKFFGVGKVTASKMQQLGIKNGKDLRSKDLTFLIKTFGKAGQYYFNIAQAKDERPVQPKRRRKSLGVEHTYDKDISMRSEILLKINELADILNDRLIRNAFFGKTITLKIKYADFTQITRSKTISYNIDNLILIRSLAVEQYETVEKNNKSIRLLGITISNQIENSNNWQLSLNF
ncbi:DNA polymerase IV [Bacteroidota bacterium]